MSDKSAIEWTDATWNPVRGCARVSDGCRHCYAERVAARFSGPGQPYEGLIHAKTRGWNGRVRLVPEALSIPWRWSRGRRIFVNSMSDLFHPDVPFEFVAAVFFVMGHTTRHTYQILTKRPERALEFFDWVADYPQGFFGDDRITDVAMKDPAIAALGWNPSKGKRGGYDNCGPGWPYENVWLGVSIENEAVASDRILPLLSCDAAVRWVSAEPLLGPLDLSHYLQRGVWCGSNGTQPRIDWVVAGGESGPGARPMHPDWARALRDQCAAAGVPFLFKQWGAWAPDDGSNGLAGLDHAIAASKRGTAFAGEAEVYLYGKKAAGRLLDGVLHDAYPESAHG